MSWLGRATTSFTHSPNPIALKNKDGSLTDLVEVCKSSTPPCHLNPLLFNGHLQTAWTAMKIEAPHVHYKRKIFEADDPNFHGTFAVDFAVKPYTESDDNLPPRTTYYTDEEFEHIGSQDSKPMLVTLHGLSGGSYESYLRHVLAGLVGVDDEKQWEACVVNSRGCAMHKITSSVLFNAKSTWDCRQVVKWLRKKFPNRKLFGIGFSLGANIMTNYVAEEGSACEFTAAIACSNPWNLEISCVALKRSYLGKEVYLRVMGGNCARLIEHHVDQVTKNPKIDLERIRQVKYLYEFDREVQVPTWGYPTEGAYYRDASSCDAVLGIRIPFLAINARDDPISVDEAIPYQEFGQNPYTVLCTTSMGGHLGWFEIGGHRWHARPAVNFFNKMAYEVEVASEPGLGLDDAAKPNPISPNFTPTISKWDMKGPPN